ncbi:MAG: 3-oxoacyl-[acyl-carrier-protein] reductase [Nitrospinae bacterium]|nr:3-oxoacyl-[acyl-carrier-protein] reductase [Nitrospinota bacterium]MBI3813189.1 3-oxoacyl-[acyl-carrier-protein] reductase [Nitrospinota bacterium]
MNLQGKVAVVTGAAKGIGRTIAIALAEDGADLVITENVSSASDTAQRIETIGRKALVVKADVSNLEDAGKVIESCIEKFGKIDILVNNAGINRDTLILRMKKEDWDSVIAVNLTGTFNCTKAASKYMIKQKGGKIVNITSIVGVMGNPGQANYAASKAGIIGFTKSVARELASRNITVNAVAPGYIVTDMTEALPENAKIELTKLIPMERFGTPEDIAHCVCFLVSERASYITGQVIHVNGGMYM